MKLDDLLLKKEEIPITREFKFRVPIHPILLSNEIKLDPRLANKVFPDAVNEFWKDMKKYLKENNTAEVIHLKRYIAKKPIIENKGRFGDQKYFGFRDIVTLHEINNGFARALDLNGYQNVVIDNAPFNFWTKFSGEKIKEYSDPSIIGFGHAYLPDNNVQTFDTASLLHNWTILYLNKALRRAAKQI